MTVEVHSLPLTPVWPWRRVTEGCGLYAFGLINKLINCMHLFISASASYLVMTWGRSGLWSEKEERRMVWWMRWRHSVMFGKWVKRKGRVCICVYACVRLCVVSQLRLGLCVLTVHNFIPLGGQRNSASASCSNCLKSYTNKPLWQCTYAHMWTISCPMLMSGFNKVLCRWGLHSYQME